MREPSGCGRGQITLLLGDGDAPVPFFGSLPEDARAPALLPSEKVFGWAYVHFVHVRRIRRGARSCERREKVQSRTELVKSIGVSAPWSDARC